MRVLITNSSDDVARIASEHLLDIVANNPTAVLGLATGSTPIATYAELVNRTHTHRISFRDVTTFNLDEYVGIEPDHENSFRAFMNSHLFQHLDIERCNTHLPHCRNLADANHHAAMFEQAIAQVGGIDCQLLGIGSNGHIGFNEPYSSLASRTRVKTLTAQTIEDNRRFFEDAGALPTLAITMGIGTILDSREVMLLATGDAKARAVRDAIEGPLSARCPASALQLHPRVTVVLDQAAASQMSDSSYFDWVMQHESGANGHAVAFGPKAIAMGDACG